jgi:hypothetical protein
MTSSGWTRRPRRRWGLWRGSSGRGASHKTSVPNHAVAGNWQSKAVTDATASARTASVVLLIAGGGRKGEDGHVGRDTQPGGAVEPDAVAADGRLSRRHLHQDGAFG